MTNHGIPLQPSQSPYNVSGSLYNNHHAPPPPPPPRPLVQFPVVTPPMPPSQHQQQQQQHYQTYQGVYSPPSQYNYQHQQNYYYEQQQQQQQHQGRGASQLMMHQDPYSSYPYYANNYANPPPPPPRPQQHHQHHRGGGGGGGRKHGCQIKNADAASSLRQSLLPLVAATSTKSTLDEKSIDKSTHKKGVNPKMVQKYAGRGLKTITVSAPGMRPQKFRICVGNHPDDVKEWIEERKRRFPRQRSSTVEGGGEERREDKEVVGSAVSSCKRMRDDHDGDEGGVETKKAINNENADEDHDGCGKRANIGGLSSLLAGYNSSSSTEEATSTSKDIHLRYTAATTTSMTETTITSTDLTPPKRICRHYRRGNCRLGASCKFLHSTDPIVVPATGDGTNCNSTCRQKNNGQSQSEKDKARNRRDGEMRALGLALPVRDNKNGKVIDSTSLLHKLLRRDKEREHRLTLQLLRYIVDSDHFQAGDEDAADKEKINSKTSVSK